MMGIVSPLIHLGAKQDRSEEGSIMPEETEKTTEDPEIEEIRTWAEQYATEHGWVVNPDPKQLSAVLRGLARNRNRFGEAYCPCRLRSGEKEKDKVLICPCSFHQDEVTGQGHCHCRLFFQNEGEEKPDSS